MPRPEINLSPQLYRQFDDQPSTRPAFFRLNEDLLPAIRAGLQKIPQLKDFRGAVRIIFGASDPYLNTGVAQRFVQMDEPEEVARLILSAPRPNY